MNSRVAAAAERAGKTAHAFILDAIAQTVEQTEVDDALDMLAEKRWADFLADGKPVPWDEAKSWLKAGARGEHPPRPLARKLGG